MIRRLLPLPRFSPSSSSSSFLYGFARPATGQTFTVLLPRVNVERMTEALAAFAAHADPGGKKLLLVVVDNAGWHRARRLPVPANVRLHFLPPCTPELQPVEPFWVLVREAVANDTFDRLADLRRVIRRRCRRLAEDRATVRGAVGFRWRPGWNGKPSMQDGIISPGYYPGLSPGGAPPGRRRSPSRSVRAGMSSPLPSW